MDLKIVHAVFLFAVVSAAAGFNAVRNPDCGIALDVKSYVFLDKFCEDCYNIFRLDELYHECQKDCYDNNMFFYCLNITLVDKETTARAASIISGIIQPDQCGRLTPWP